MQRHRAVDRTINVTSFREMKEFICGWLRQTRACGHAVKKLQAHAVV